MFSNLRSLIFKLDPETAHNLAIKSLKFNFVPNISDENKDDPLYVKMSNNYENSIAFQTACDLVFKGKEQPSGYTEPLLHLNRLKKKSNLSSKSY